MPTRRAALAREVETMTANQQRYAGIESQIGVPWYVTACIHGLEHSSTRKLARQAIRLVNHWRREAAATAATTSDSRCDAAAQRIGAADTSSPPSADRSNDVGGGAGDGQTTVCGRRSSAPSPTPTTPRL